MDPDDPDPDPHPEEQRSDGTGPAPPGPALPTGTAALLWLGARPRTLPAAVAPVLVGTAAVVGLADVVWWRFLCALAVAVLVQVGTNYANDLSDGVRGTDDPGTRTGPPRLVGSGLLPAVTVKRAVLASFALTLLAGTPLVLFVDWRLALVGVAAVAAGWFYTGGPRPYGYAGLGEVVVFTFFGLVATVGSGWVQVQEVTALLVVCGAAMGCLATALLVVNNLRDIPGDRRSGKHTLAVRLGAERTRLLWVALIVVPVLLLPVLVAMGAPPAVAVALVVVVPARSSVVAVLEGASGPALVPVLARTGLVQLAYGVLVTAAFLFDAGTS